MPKFRFVVALPSKREFSHVLVAQNEYSAWDQFLALVDQFATENASEFEDRVEAKLCFRTAKMSELDG